MPKPRGLHYVSDKDLVWRRVRRGKNFRFINRFGFPIKASDAQRVKALVIPPAWEDVHISPDANGHIQATGLDEKGRKQYIYHSAWTAYNQQHKFDSLKKFGEVLPTVRAVIAGHMRQRELTRERVLATVVWLLENTFIRVGNKEYADENQSYGLTTMRTKHVDIVGNKIKFSFKGKSHVYHELDISSPRVAQTIKECIELPGYQIFKYIESGKKKTIDSAEVNEYLKEISGEPLSAKDFRTWGGTTLAGDALYRIGEPTVELPTEKVIGEVVAEVAQHLGNTVAVCREYYIHPKVISSYEKDALISHFTKIEKMKSKIPKNMSWQEYATWSLL